MKIIPLQETKLFKHMAKKGVKSHIICQKNNSLNKWGAKLYKSEGFKTIIKHNREENLRDLNILGNIILQVEYSKKIANKIKKFYEEYKTTQDLSLKDITELAHEPCEIKLILFKNPEIAKSLREKYLKLFQK